MGNYFAPIEQCANLKLTTSNDRKKITTLPLNKSEMEPTRKHKPFENSEVAAVFDACPKKIRTRMLFLRELIFEIAAKTPSVGKLDETLKWGSPSYLTTETNSGTTIRIEKIVSEKEKFAMRVHCQTTLVQPFKKIYGDDAFDYDANRGVILDVNDEIPVKELSHFIFMALTYHLTKKRKLFN